MHIELTQTLKTFQVKIEIKKLDWEKNIVWLCTLTLGPAHE